MPGAVQDAEDTKKNGNSVLIVSRQMWGWYYRAIRVVGWHGGEGLNKSIQSTKAPSSLTTGDMKAGEGEVLTGA